MEVNVSIKLDVINITLELPDHLLKYKNEDNFESILKEHVKQNKLDTIYEVIKNQASSSFNGISVRYVGKE